MGEEEDKSRKKSWQINQTMQREEFYQFSWKFLKRKESRIKTVNNTSKKEIGAKIQGQRKEG